VKRGDLIQLCEDERPGGQWYAPDEPRIRGVVLGFDDVERDWNGRNTYIEPQVLVLWNTGQSGWIMKERTEILHEAPE